MNNLDFTQFKDATANLQNMIDSMSHEAVNILSEYKTEMIKGCKPEPITKEFNEFLYTVLVKNGINSTNKNTPVLNLVNTPNGSLYNNYINITNPSTKEVFVASNVGNHYVSHYTVGRSIGLTYKLNSTTRTKFINRYMLFYYLKPEFVSLVTNKRKKACLQSFCELKQSIINDMDSLNNYLMELSVPIPIKTHDMYNITITNSTGSRYLTTPSQYTCINSDHDFEITHMWFTMAKPHYNWNDCMFTHSSNINKSMSNNIHPNITCILLNKQQNQFINIGNFTVNQTDIIIHPLHVLQDNINKTVYTQSYTGDKYTENPINYDKFNDYVKAYPRYPVVGNEKIFLDYPLLFKNDTLRSELNKRIDMFKSWYTRLFDIKNEYADLYFLHSDTI